MLHQLTITCDYPAQLIGFHMQNCTDNTELTFNALVPIEDSDEALYAWGTPKDASAVEYTHSDAGYCIYRFETPICLRVGPLRTRFPPLLTPLGIPGMLKSSFSSSFCNGFLITGRGNRCLR